MIHHLNACPTCHATGTLTVQGPDGWSRLICSGCARTLRTIPRLWPEPVITIADGREHMWTRPSRPVK